jgi:hypothetical protein
MTSFASTLDPHYQGMLTIIREARDRALAKPRVDMPGAEVIAGASRQFLPPPLPDRAPPLIACASEDEGIHLAWENSAATIGLEAELHRSDRKDFVPDKKNLLVRTSSFQHQDRTPPLGPQHYALVLVSAEGLSKPSYTTVIVPPPQKPPAPNFLKVVPASGAVRLQWQAPRAGILGYHVYRGKPGNKELARLTMQPVPQTNYSDGTGEPKTPYFYAVRSVSHRGLESSATSPVVGTANVLEQPVFQVQLDPGFRGLLYDAPALSGQLHGGAKAVQGVLEIGQGGHASVAHDARFDLVQPLTVECWVFFDRPGKMPVVVSCGSWHQAGWFLQRLGGVWRWHVAGVDCDGGRPVEGRWIHLAGIYDGNRAQLFVDGVKVGEKTGARNDAPWPGDLCLGQYSAQPSEPYQVFGRIAGVKIFHRVLKPAEAASAAKHPPR